MTPRPACSSAISISTPSATTKRRGGTRTRCSVDPKNVNASTDLGIAYYYTNQPDRALAQFDRSLAIDPKHSKTLLNIGIVRAFGKQDLDGAAKAWQRVLDVAPDSAGSGHARSKGSKGLRAAHGPGGRAPAAPKPPGSRTESWPRLHPLGCPLLILGALAVERLSTASSRRDEGAGYTREPRRSECRTRSRSRLRRRSSCRVEALTSGTGSRRRGYFCSEKCRAANVDRADETVMPIRIAAARRHRRSRPAPVRARLYRLERRQHQRPARRRSAADDARPASARAS